MEIKKRRNVYIYIHIYTYIHTYINDKMNKINKMDLYCIKCLKVADNRTVIELKYETDGINRLCYNWVVVEYLDYYLEKLYIREKLG